jgi:hypothetical protein
MSRVPQNNRQDAKDAKIQERLIYVVLAVLGFLGDLSVLAVHFGLCTYFVTVRLSVPMLPLVSNARREILCSPGVLIERSSV